MKLKQNVRRIGAMALLAALLLASLPAAVLADGTAFDNIAYIGDPGACKMDAKMALAYAEVIDSLPNDKGDFYVTLADFADDGYPILFTMNIDKTSTIDYWFANDEEFSGYMLSSPTFWGYKDGAAYKTETTWASYGKLGEKGMLYYHEGGPNESLSWYYTISQGQIELAHYIISYYAKWDEARGKFEEPFPEGAAYAKTDGTPDESKLAENGWIQREDGTWRLTLDNGEPVTRKYLDEGLDSILGATSDEKGRIAYIGEGVFPGVVYIDSSPAADVSAALRVYAASAGGPSAPAYTALSGIAYAGDISKCSMDAQMALAYANAVAGLPATASDEYEGTGMLHAALVDYAGDGWPILITVYRTGRAWFDLKLWGYQNGSAYQVDPGFRNDLFDVYYYGELDGNSAIAKRNLVQSVGISTFEVYYTISHGRITVSHTIANCAIKDYYGLADYNDPGVVYADDYDGSLPDFTAGAVIEKEEQYGYYRLDAAILAKNGWRHDGNFWFLSVHNGEVVSEQPTPDFEQKETIAYKPSDIGDPEIINTTPASDAANALRGYAQRASGYSYPQPAVDEDEYARDIVDLIKTAFGTDDVTVYKLADGLYLIVVFIDGTQQAALVEGRRVKGRLEWEITERYPEPPAREELETVIIERASTPNIAPDFSKISGFKSIDDFRAYAEDLLNNMPGAVPNDAGKNALGSFIEESISGLRLVVLPDSGGRVTIDGDSLSDAAGQAVRDRADIEDWLRQEDIKLNKSITVILLVVCRGMDLSEPCQITLDSSLAEALRGCGLRIIVGDERHYIQFSAQRLAALIERYGALNIQISEIEDNCCVINFLDGEETLLEELIEPVTVGLPAAGYTSTVMVSYAGRSENWGGQYDPATGTIAFDTRYSGRNEVIDNNVEIGDISELPEDIQKAIAFMVSKGYMNAPEGRFEPDAYLSRYEFTQALTGMFFALDRSLESSFPDVLEDSPYYAYVASAEAQSIVTGFDDGTFRGDNTMTVEQMLALAARTLIDKKGYIEPETPESYLRSFSDGESVSAWAAAQVAMSVRDGIYDRGGMLNPQGDITRAQAADILYRLFLLLYDAPPVALELPDAPPEAEPPGNGDAAATESEDGTENSGVPVVAIACAAGGVLAAGGGGAAWYLTIKKRRKTGVSK